MKHRKMLAGVIAAIAAVTLVTGCTSDPPADDAPTVLTFAQVSIAQVNFDPVASSNNSRNFLTPVYDTLIFRTSASEYLPALATKFEYTSPTSFAMTIREGIKFDDGTMLDAEAVKANLDYYRSNTGPLVAGLGVVEEVVVTGDYTLELRLSQPDPTMPHILSSTIGSIANPALLGTDKLIAEPAGTGPYTLDVSRTEVGTEYTYIKRPDHWNSENFVYDQIVIKFIADQQAILNALQAGEVNMTAVTNDLLADSARKSGLEVVSGPFNIDNVDLYDRDGVLVPALGDVRVRQALNYAVDRQTLADGITFGIGIPTDQMLVPGLPGNDPKFEDRYPYDPDMARKLLRDAGYPDGFELPIVVSTTSEPKLTALAALLGEVGVRVKIISVPSSQIVDEVLSGNHPAAYLPLSFIEPFADLKRVATPEAAFNPLRTENPEILDLFEQAASADAAEREALLRKINKILIDDAWFLPLFTTNLSFITDGSVGDIKFDSVFPIPFYGWHPAN